MLQFSPDKRVLVSAVGEVQLRGVLFWKARLGYTVPKEIDFPQYNMNCSGENVILRGIVHVVLVSCFPLHFMIYRGNFDCFSYSLVRYD